MRKNGPSYGLKRFSIVGLLLLIPAVAAPADSARERFNRAIDAFGDGEYEAAAELFDVLVEEETDSVRDALYWSARSYLAAELSDAADARFERFIDEYPEHEYVEEAVYHRGRASFLEAEYETAVRRFDRFLEDFPESDYAGNAYYWSGESLMSLGRYEEARDLFRTVVVDFPRSFRVEAARYRLELIDLSRRERELLELLRWSNEEQLRLAAELRLREREYEQAVDGYRRQLAEMEEEAERSVETDELRERERQLEERLEAVRLREEAVELLESLEPTEGRHE